MRSLRARLFGAILVVALLSLALALAIGALLTRRAVERNTLKDVSAQLDLLVEREKDALLPFSPSTLRALRPFLERQDERVVQVRLDGSSALLPPERAAALRRSRTLRGTLEFDGERYLYATRLSSARASCCSGPPTRRTAGGRTSRRSRSPRRRGVLAAPIAFLLARAISRPMRGWPRRAASSPRDGPSRVPAKGLRARGARRSVQRAGAARPRAGGRAFVPALGQPRAEDAADGDPRLRRGAPRGRAAGDEAADGGRRGVEAPRAAGRRPARPRPDEPRRFRRPPEPIDLAEGRADAVRRYESRRSSSASRSRPSAAANAPALADPDRTLQVVSNLVENALRLAHRRAARVADRGRAGRDRGRGHRAGPAPEDSSHAFERFYLYSRYGARAAGRHRPRPRDRQGAHRGDGRHGRGDEPAGEPDRLQDPPAPAARSPHAEPRRARPGLAKGLTGNHSRRGREAVAFRDLARLESARADSGLAPA